MTTELEKPFETESEWEPDPDDWYTASICTVCRGNDFVFARLDNDEDVFVHQRDIRPPGVHYCPTALPLGTEISVRIQRARPARPHHAAAYVALEAQVKSQKLSREISRVVSWTGTYGSIRRDPCNCVIFGKTKSPDDYYDLKPGDRVSHEVVLSNRPGKGFIAVSIKPLEDLTAQADGEQE